MQDDAADELHIKRALTQHTPVRLAHNRKSVGQDVVQRLACGKPLLEGGGLRAQRRVIHRLILRCKRVNLICNDFQFLNLVVAVSAEYFCKKSHISILP